MSLLQSSHKNLSRVFKENIILSSTYQNAPGPSGHTNIKVGSEAAIVTLVLGSDGIHNLVVYSIIQYYITI